MTTPISSSTCAGTATAAYAFQVVAHRGAWSSLRARIAAFIQKLIDEYRARRARGSLESLSDRELRDIGLRRADIEFERWDRASLFEMSHFYGN